MAVKHASGEEEIRKLWDDVRELSLGTSSYIKRLKSPPSPIEFLRNFVTPNKPCIISNALQHWPALSLWSSDDYLCSTLGSSEVSVHLTPNGRADSLVPHPKDASSLCFASAHVEKMSFSDALPLITEPKKENDNVVAYMQQQNDCFRYEYPILFSDCDKHISWASEALGCLPEAVNLWIGNDQSETSFHKDHYENIYAVVSGEKHFILLPPTDVHRLYIRSYLSAQYSYDKDKREFTLELDDLEKSVPWCSVNPEPSQEMKDKELNEFPLYFDGPKPFECIVKAGEILYLPSMWFHYVKQSPRTIAVNYWYDMQFDIKYAYFNFLQSLNPLSTP